MITISVTVQAACVQHIQPHLYDNIFELGLKHYHIIEQLSGGNLYFENMAATMMTQLSESNKALEDRIIDKYDATT